MGRAWLLLLVGLVAGWVLGYTTRRPGGLPTVRIPEPGEMPDVEGLVGEGKKIDAIKAYRERTGAGLGEAKAVVEALQRRMRA